MNPLARHFAETAQPAEPVPADVKPTGPIPAFRAVVFDIYGTLFQSAVGDISLIDFSNSGSRNVLLASVLEKAGFTLQDKSFPFADALTETITVHQDAVRSAETPFPEVDIRMVWQDLILNLRRESVVENGPAIDDVLMNNVSVWYEAAVNPVYPMPDCQKVLDTLRQRGTVMGIVSNAQFFTPLLFDAFFNRSFTQMGFAPDCCFFSYTFLKAKPDTFLYAKCAEVLDTQYGIAAEDVLYVGNDRRNDVWPARQIGFRTALFAGDTKSYRPRPGDPDLVEAHPDFVIHQLASLIEAVSG